MLELSKTPTGRVLTIITPDSQRTMYPNLGASGEMLPAELTDAKFKDAAIVHIEGYLLFNKDLFIASLQAARKAGALVSLDMASFTVVEVCRETILEVAGKYVDILIANEDEARVYTGTSNEEEALQILGKNVPVAVLKQGRRGSMILSEGKVTQIPIAGDGSAIDTTGAGDLWAAGFLYGLSRGWDVAKSGELASRCGAEVCKVVGAHVPDAVWSSIRSDFKIA